MPWEFADKDNKFVGFEIDLVNEIGKRLGRPVEITNIPFNGLFAAVESGRIDGAVSSITITPKRLQSLSFAQPYYDSDQSLTVKTDSGITTLEGLKDKVVGVDTGSTGDMWTTENQAKYGIKEIKRYEGLAPAMLDLEAGRMDGYISDIPALLYYTKDKPQLKVVQRIKTNEKYSVMFAKDSPLMTQFNDQITALKQDGTLPALHEKWFGVKPDAGTSTIDVQEIPKAEAAAAAVAAGPAIKIGANIGNVPWEFADKDNKFVGFEIDLVNEIGKRLGRPVEITNIPFNGLFAAVESGRIDGAVSSITITPKRLQSLSFAQPYYDSDQSLTVKTDSGITTLEGLKDKVVGVDTGSTGDMWTTENQAKYGIKEIKRYEGLAPAMLDLEAGRMDGYISDIPALLYYTKDKPQLKVVQRIKTNEKYSVMFAKDSPLMTQFNDQITALKQDGTLPALHEKWFGVKPDAGTSTIDVAEIPKP